MSSGRSSGWLVGLIALPASVAVWSGWVGLGGLTGFGEVHPLPGIADDVSLDTAITLPIGVEAYAAYALRVWLTSDSPSDVGSPAARFARASAVGSLMLGAAGQVAYHVMAAGGVSRAPWPVVAFVACLPVLVLGMAATLHHLTGRPVPAAPVAAVDQPEEDGMAWVEPVEDVQEHVEIVQQDVATLARETDTPTVLLDTGATSADGFREYEKGFREKLRERQEVLADEPERPRRAVRPAGRPNGTREEFLRREGTKEPMTWEEIVTCDGGTKKSAEGKMYRWRKSTRG